MIYLVRRLLFVGILFILASCVATGDKALALMTPDQREFAESVLASIPMGSSPEEVSAVLGEPYRNTPGKFFWRREGGEESERIDGYFQEGKLFKIRFVSVDPIFGWEPPQ